MTPQGKERRQSADSATYGPTDNQKFAQNGLLQDFESTADNTVELERMVCRRKVKMELVRVRFAEFLLFQRRNLD